MSQMNADKSRDDVHPELSHAIIGAAMRVLNELKPGLDEKVYENALVLELRAMGHHVEQQRSFEVFYRGQLVGRMVPDLLVDGKVVVDPKVAENFHENHVAKMLGYLAITGFELALLLNFKHAKLGIRRVVKSTRP